MGEAMNLERLGHNATVLYQHANDNLRIDDEGQLQVIRWYNLIDRFIKWLDADNIDFKISVLARDTLQEMHKFNEDVHAFNLNAKQQGSLGHKIFFYIDTMVDDEWWNPPPISCAWGTYCTATAVGKKVLSSKLPSKDENTDKEIQALINALIQQQKEFYPEDDDLIGVDYISDRSLSGGYEVYRVSDKVYFPPEPSKFMLLGRKEARR
jgi:hypothetical protein